MGNLGVFDGVPAELQMVPGVTVVTDGVTAGYP